MPTSRLHITVFLGLAVLVWGLVLIVRGTPVSARDLTPFGFVVGSLVLFGLAFEHLLWRQRWLHGWFVARPDVRGTWRVTLQSDWINPNTQAALAPITCYMGVMQTLSKLQMHLMTPESESWFVAHAIRPSLSENGYQIYGVYTNKPKAHLRVKQSQIHLGAIIIDTHGLNAAKPESLTAEYWTDRKTTGTMTFERRLPKVFTRFTDAQEAFGDG